MRKPPEDWMVEMPIDDEGSRYTKHESFQAARAEIENAPGFAGWV